VGAGMLKRYSIRLGDGTILKVAPDGLKTWLEDEQASVQIAGTQEWRSLRDFLAEERSAARLAEALVPPAARSASAPSPPEALSRPRFEPSLGAPPVVQALAEEPAAAPVPPWRQSPEPGGEAPILRLKPLEDDLPGPHGMLRTEEFEGVEEGDDAPRQDRLDGPLLLVLTALGTLLSRCLDPLTPLVRGWPSTSPSRPAPEGPPAPARRPPLGPPVSVSELPVLRFADADEQWEAEEVYGGEEARSLLPTLWLWTWRIVLAGALGGAVLAALRWETWFPRAAQLGQTVFTGIDRQVRSGQRAEEGEQALREATERLPHLSPKTIGLILSASPDGVLAPPEVFQVAREAADRGRPTLTRPEAAELAALERELLAHLRPPERARLAEYDRARSGRAVFPFENPYALELVARGARDMPAPSRERLRTLLGQAVAGGLHGGTGATLP
jgi:hypothetical protein